MSTLTEFIPLLQETALAWGIALTDEQTAQFMRYAEILIDWNQRMNLTALIAPRDIIVRHFLDSLSCARGWRETPDLLADIGSGAGFPGLALKIAFPSIRVVLV